MRFVKTCLLGKRAWQAGMTPLFFGWQAHRTRPQRRGARIPTLIVGSLILTFIVRSLTLTFIVRSLTLTFIVGSLTLTFIVRSLTLTFIVRSLTLTFIVRGGQNSQISGCQTIDA